MRSSVEPGSTWCCHAWSRSRRGGGRNAGSRCRLAERFRQAGVPLMAVEAAVSGRLGPELQKPALREAGMIW